jgi:hypothetical protein
MLVALGEGPLDADISVALHNASPSGVAFLCARPIRVDALVFIKLFWHDPNCPRVPACVRHTTEVDHGFLIGCRFCVDEERAPAAASRVARAWYE